MGSQHAILVATVPRETSATTSSPWRNSEEPWHQAHPPQQEPSWGSTKESLEGRRREGTGRWQPSPRTGQRTWERHCRHCTAARKHY